MGTAESQFGMGQTNLLRLGVEAEGDAVSVFCDFPLEKLCVGLTELFFPFVMSSRRSLVLLSCSGIAVSVSPLSKVPLPESNEDGGRGRDLKDD